MKNKKIAIFYGGKISQHLVMIREAAKKLGAELELISYNRVGFDTEKGEVFIRGGAGKWEKRIDINSFEVIFFRTTGKHWEEVNLVIDGIKNKDIKIVDPLVKVGKPSMACKAYQMLELKKAGIDVPKTVYGSLQYLRESGILQFNFPVILKGSGGDRGTRVYKADSQKELEALTDEMRRSEIEEGRRYMLQEYIPNDGDYRVLVLGDKVLGAMKRFSQSSDEFRNNYSAGGGVEIANLPEELYDLAIKAAKTCGLLVAGVDIAFRNFDKDKPVIWEVNKGPQFSGFMKATGIDVPNEIVKFLMEV